MTGADGGGALTRAHEDEHDHGQDTVRPVQAAPGAVPVDEPPSPDRIRRPSDAIRFAASVAGLLAVMLLVSFAPQATHGLQTDITQGTAHAPRPLLTLATLVSSFGVLAVPVAFAVERLFRKEGTRVAIALLAAVITFTLTVLLDDMVISSAPGGVLDSLIWGGTDTAPVHTDIAPVIAFISAVGMAGRKRWMAVTWTMIGLAALTGLTAGYASVAALAATFFLGHAIGHGTLYAVGTPNPRPSGRAVVTALERLGLRTAQARRLPGEDDETRRYRVRIAHAPEAVPTGTSGTALPRGEWQLEVGVLDRDLQTAGLLYRLWRAVRLREPAQRRPVRSLRRSLEQESLMAYAIDAAGARTPRLVGTCEVGTEAALMAYEYVPGPRLDEIPDEDLTDALLTDIWEQLRRLQSARLAHRRLEGGAILVSDEGRAYLTDLGTGEIAAGDLALRLDLAQLLTTLALRVGPERAVRTAVGVLGEQALAAAVPLLQRAALSRRTRTALRHDRELLTRIREQIVQLKPESDEAPPVRLERFRLRTIVSIVALTAAAYIVVPQLSSVDPVRLVAGAEWWWAGLALGAAALTYLAAAFMLMGFVPERLPLGRTVLVQLAASFVRLVAPAAVGGVALNTRYLQRSGVRPGPAVASVGASQLMGLAMHVLLLVIFGFITGSAANATRDLAPSRTIVIVLLAAAVLASIALTIPKVRRVVAGRLKSMFSGVVPRLIDVLQSPKKIITGVGGTLLLTAGFVLCLDASIRAFGGSLPWTSIVVVFLTANALGSAAPTPGGLGAVETALTVALTISGLTAEAATSAVLLYRLLTFWLPVLPGWAAFAYLQRKEAV
ncbi:flippase-like domain-containing protein [Actinomadura sp. SCN-SB]|uniref:flippase-like domain-containing protein n=1 Tax=Actinomadura sp. SCN-SB TaxID=3373092 RepID=UPI003750FE1B